MECEQYIKTCVIIYDDDWVEAILRNRSWLLYGGLPLFPGPLNPPVVL